MTTCIAGNWASSATVVTRRNPGLWQIWYRSTRTPGSRSWGRTRQPTAGAVIPTSGTTPSPGCAPTVSHVMRATTPEPRIPITSPAVSGPTARSAIPSTRCAGEATSITRPRISAHGCPPRASVLAVPCRKRFPLRQDRLLWLPRTGLRQRGESETHRFLHSVPFVPHHDCVAAALHIRRSNFGVHIAVPCAVFPGTRSTAGRAKHSSPRVPVHRHHDLIAHHQRTAPSPSTGYSRPCAIRVTSRHSPRPRTQSTRGLRRIARRVIPPPRGGRRPSITT